MVLAAVLINTRIVSLRRPQVVPQVTLFQFLSDARLIFTQPHPVLPFPRVRKSPCELAELTRVTPEACTLQRDGLHSRYSGGRNRCEQGSEIMEKTTEDIVVDFYYDLFCQLFSARFKTGITRRLRRDAVVRQIQESAGAASQSLTRFFENQQVPPPEVETMLAAMVCIAGSLSFEDISNPNVVPETLLDQVSRTAPCPSIFLDTFIASVYREALYLVVQVLLLVGPIMAEWEKLHFAETFEPPRRVVNRLNQITQRLRVLGVEATDERYEVIYRDYLLQRFYRIEVGTVKMTTNASVDLRELFVMPNVLPRGNDKVGSPQRGSMECC